MNFPNLLIIGAMKAGTTSLYMDLTSHPRVYRAEDKEPHALCSDAVLTESGRAAYGNSYANLSSQTIVPDASTGYSKRPDQEGVVDRAVKTLPDGFRVIYVVRHPIDRIISQHHHEYTAGTASADFNAEVRNESKYLNYSRYAYQLTPWLEALGRDRVLVLKFEDYIESRSETMEKVRQFLDLDDQVISEDQTQVYNKTAGKPVRNRFWDLVFHSRAYRLMVRRVLSPRVRLTLMQWFLPKGSLQPEAPSPETISWLREQLQPDLTELQEMLELGVPLWEDLCTDVQNPTSSVATT